MISAICQNSVRSSSFAVKLTSHHLLGTFARFERLLFLTTFIIIFHWFHYFLIVFFNIYVNDYIVIKKHIPSGGYNICILYDCFWGQERITPFKG